MQPLEPFLRRIALAIEQTAVDHRNQYHPPCPTCGRTLNLAHRRVCDACGCFATAVAQKFSK